MGGKARCLGSTSMVGGKRQKFSWLNYGKITKFAISNHKHMCHFNHSDSFQIWLQRSHTSARFAMQTPWFLFWKAPWTNHAVTSRWVPWWVLTFLESFFYLYLFLTWISTIRKYVYVYIFIHLYTYIFHIVCYCLLLFVTVCDCLLLFVTVCFMSHQKEVFGQGIWRYLGLAADIPN